MCNDGTKILKPRPHPKAYPHGELEEILENVYMVTGTIQMTMMLGMISMSFSRNMKVIRQKNESGQDELILGNSLRLNEDGLRKLDALGEVKHIIRLGGFHGMDDPWYKQRYPEATVWVVADTTYFPDFKADSKEVYFEADQQMNADSKLPVKKASLVIIDSKSPKDGILVIDRPEGKVLMTGDSLQNMEKCDSYFNYLGRVCMKMMGFIHPCQVGPAWSKVSEVQPEEMQKLLELKFDHVLPTHGSPVLGQAWKKYEPSIMGMTKS